MGVFGSQVRMLGLDAMGTRKQSGKMKVVSIRGLIWLTILPGKKGARGAAHRSRQLQGASQGRCSFLYPWGPGI